VWQVEGDAWTLLTDGKEPGPYFSPEAAVDADGDGAIELIGVTHLVRAIGGVHRQAESIEVPDFDCPC
jgi:hypothetical protein